MPTPPVVSKEYEGAIEDNPQDPNSAPSQVSLDGQQGHRDQDPMIKSSDSDFPEPDADEEHTGEPGA
ncbi:MAG: hypothetical protein V4555_13105 [Acidobacteriota bacterium]